MSENSSLVIDTLKRSAIALEKQDRESAITNLRGIADEVNSLRKSAEKSENEAKILASGTTAQISELIKKQGEAHADFEKIKKELDETYTEIAAKKVSIQDLNLRITNSKREMDTYYEELRRCEARIEDLNDTSAGSIILSILSLGLDRAVKAIAIEIDGVRAKIGIASTTIAAYSSNLTILQTQLDLDNSRINSLNASVDQKNKQVKDLNFLEFKLHNQEKIQRKRLVFFTEINLFYTKLENLSDSVSHRIDDVRDIVEELDSRTPTITSFDASQHDLISLEEAIMVFGENLANGVSVDSLEPVFAENGWYYITNEWLGEKRVLTIVPGDGSNNRILMSDINNSPSQRWKITASGNGYYQLTVQLFEEKKSLSVSDAEAGYKPVLADTVNNPGQQWKIEPEFEYFRITNLLPGENKSLNIVDSGANAEIVINDSGNYSGQQWKFVLSP